MTHRNFSQCNFFAINFTKHIHTHTQDICRYSRDWPVNLAVLLLIARVMRHVQTTRHLSVLTRLESIYYTGWVIRTGAIREKRLLIKLSFTRVNYPDGTSGETNCDSWSTLREAVSRLINVTALLRNRRFSFAYKYLCFLDLHFPDVLPTCFLSASFRIYVESWILGIVNFFAKIILSERRFYYLVENVYMSFTFLWKSVVECHDNGHHYVCLLWYSTLLAYLIT